MVSLKMYLVITMIIFSFSDSVYTLRRTCAARIYYSDLIMQWTTKTVWENASNLRGKMQTEEGFAAKYVDFLRVEKNYKESEMIMANWANNVIDYQSRSKCLGELLENELLKNLITKTVYEKIREMSDEEMNSVIDDIKAAYKGRIELLGPSPLNDAEVEREKNIMIYERLQEQVILIEYLLFLRQHEDMTDEIYMEAWCKKNQPLTCTEILKSTSLLYDDDSKIFRDLPGINKFLRSINGEDIVNLDPVIVRYVKYFKSMHSDLLNGSTVNSNTYLPDEWCEEVEHFCIEDIRMAGYKIDGATIYTETVQKNKEHALSLNKNKWTTHWNYAKDTVYAVSYGEYILDESNGGKKIGVEYWCLTDCIDKVEKSGLEKKNLKKLKPEDVRGYKGCPRRYTNIAEIYETKHSVKTFCAEKCV